MCLLTSTRIEPRPEKCRGGENRGGVHCQNSGVEGWEYSIAKIFVYKHCFCHLNAENVKRNNSLFYQPIVLWLAY